MLNLEKYINQQQLTSDLNEVATVNVDGAGEVRLMIRNRYHDGRSGNPIRHATSIKILYGEGSEVSIRIPTESYYSDTVDIITKNGFKQLRSTGITKDRCKFIESFVYDNQAAINAFWYYKDMSNSVLLAFRKYFSDKAATNGKIYSKGGIKPKTDSQLNSDRAELIEYLQKELNDPKFVL